MKERYKTNALSQSETAHALLLAGVLTALAPDKSRHSRYRIEIVRSDFLLLDFELEMGLQKLDQLDDTQRVDDAFAQQRRIIRMRKLLVTIEQARRDEAADRLFDLLVRSLIAHNYSKHRRHSP